MDAPNPDFAAVTRRFIMEMPIAARAGRPCGFAWECCEIG